jgi:hypothetical protein
MLHGFVHVVHPTRKKHDNVDGVFTAHEGVVMCLAIMIFSGNNL